MTCGQARSCGRTGRSSTAPAPKAIATGPGRLALASRRVNVLRAGIPAGIAGRHARTGLGGDATQRHTDPACSGLRGRDEMPGRRRPSGPRHGPGTARGNARVDGRAYAEHVVPVVGDPDGGEPYATRGARIRAVRVATQVADRPRLRQQADDPGVAVDLDQLAVGDP